MSYVIYNKESTIILGGHRNTFKTEAAAKAGLTRAVNKDNINRDEYAIAESQHFHESIEKQVERINLMSQKTYNEPINTPCHLSPSCESFWSM